MQRRHFPALVALVATCSLGVSLPALAQSTYPEKAVRVVVPYPPGGATDVSARLLAGEMAKLLGQGVIVENKPGVAGVIGTDMVAKSPADGYTLVFGGAGNLTLRPIMDPKLSYKVDKDLQAISHVVTYDHLLVVRNGLPARNVQEFVQLAKDRKLSYASSGSGGPQHLAMELFKSVTRTDLTHVPYKGESPAMLDLVGERVDAAIVSTAVAAQLIKGGKVRAIAAANPYRSRMFPELPTIAEAGVPGYEVEIYGGLLAPAHTPAPVIEKLQRAAVAAMKVPALQQQFTEAGLIPIGGTAADFTRLLKREREKWEPIIKASGATLE
ncbi:MAG: tripartite tricarboxylate transporter substrate binding protein [Pseudomonadota bacterium]|jgi:tripartite-type tricarboxylate transporter receptor subunit TctC